MNRIISAVITAYAIVVTWYLVEHFNPTMPNLHNLLQNIDNRQAVLCTLSVLTSFLIGGILELCMKKMTPKTVSANPPLSTLTVCDLIWDAARIRQAAKPVGRDTEWVEVPDEAILEIEVSKLTTASTARLRECFPGPRPYPTTVASARRNALCA